MFGLFHAVVAGAVLWKPLIKILQEDPLIVPKEVPPKVVVFHMCQGRSTPYIGAGHPTPNRESL